MIKVLTKEFGGSALVRAALTDTLPEGWYEPTRRNSDEWLSAARKVQKEFEGSHWLGSLEGAFTSSGGDGQAIPERLRRVADANGIVVTTGQQPGLFGGPMYSWSKALSALALADEIERSTGIPAAPVFWAATDDSDYAEASFTVVAHNSDVHRLQMPSQPDSASMAHTPLGDVSSLMAVFEQSAGSALNVAPLEAVRESYSPDETVGGAYVKLLRKMMEPMGIAVLDASHESVKVAGAPLLRKALRRADDVRDALEERSKAIESQGDYRVQVRPVKNLSLVFSSRDGERKRIAVNHAQRAAAEEQDEMLSPNVLLRPVMEKSILPTVAYVAGPAEYAYFAQVSSIADVLEVSRPAVVPRWSGMVLEPQVQEILERLELDVDDFQDPHAVESRIAREEIPVEVRAAIEGMRQSLRSHSEAIRNNSQSIPALGKSVAGFEAQMDHRIGRLERRFAAAVKRSGNSRLHEVAVARASLFPTGVMQERVLNIIPWFARYGSQVMDGMLNAARNHAATLLNSD